MEERTGRRGQNEVGDSRKKFRGGEDSSGHVAWRSSER